VVMERSPLLAIVTSSAELDSVNAIVQALGYQYAEVVEGTPLDAAAWLRQHSYSPKYILLFIGDKGREILPSIDALAECCNAGTRVVVVGVTNDIGFYRELKERGVIEYFNYPPPVEQIRQVLFQRHSDSLISGRVFSIFGGSSGDGSSTVALNLAYLLAKKHDKKVILVDLDYQFGMVSRQLELGSTYGIKEIFDHPERGVDATLIDRMVVHYRDGLDIISAPQSLHFLPQVKPDLMRDFIGHLSSKYEYVILDLPHVWNHWVSSTISASDHLILVAQLLLKSITHSSRLLNIWNELGFSNKPISVIINRSGSRYKEAVHPKDFERICGRAIDYYLPNDIKTICQSENRGVPVYEMGKSQLLNEFERIVKGLVEFSDKPKKA
jgi:pilus assembly protein CpaE